MSTGFLQFGHNIFDRNPRSVSILGTPARISSSKYIPKSSPGNLLAWHRGQTKHGMSKEETATTRDLPPKAPTLVSCIGVLHVLHFGGLTPSRGIVALDLIIRMPGTGSELFQFDSGASEVGVVSNLHRNLCKTTSHVMDETKNIRHMWDRNCSFL